MKLTVLQEDLHRALSLASRFTTSRAQLPVLANVLLSTEDHRLRLSATNLEMSVSLWLGTKTEKEGATTLPAKEIAEFISYLSPGKITLESQGESGLKVISPQSSSTFSTISAADFPQIPVPDPSKTFTLDLDTFAKDVEQVALSAATDDTRPVLTAVLWEFSSDSYQMVAADGYRLSLKKSALKNPALAPKQSFLVPVRILQELVRSLKGSEKLQIGLTKDAHQVVFALPDLHFVSRLIEGDFPDYQRILPADYKVKLVLDKEELLQAVRLASVFARESANVVRFSVAVDSLTLSANSPSVGENQVKVPAKVDGETMEIAFNYKFVLDYLSICEADTVEIRFTESLSPGLFLDAKDPAFTHLIMPVRLPE